MASAILKIGDFMKFLVATIAALFSLTAIAADAPKAEAKAPAKAEAKAPAKAKAKAKAEAPAKAEKKAEAKK
jgi:hypothetical protein